MWAWARDKVVSGLCGGELRVTLVCQGGSPQQGQVSPPSEFK